MVTFMFPGSFHCQMISASSQATRSCLTDSMEETKIRLPGPGVFPTDMLGECECLEKTRRLGKDSSIIYLPINMILLVFLNAIYRSFLASIAFACQKSQSFLTKMPLAQRKMCLEWSPGDQDGRFLRMAEASRPRAIHGVIRSSSNHIPRRCSNQHSGPTGSFRNHHAQVRQKSCKPRLHQTLESNEDLYIALIPAAKTQFHQKSASDGLSQSHSLVQKAKADETAELSEAHWKRWDPKSHHHGGRRLKSKEPGADNSKGGPPCSQRSDS